MEISSEPVENVPAPSVTAAATRDEEHVSIFTTVINAYRKTYSFSFVNPSLGSWLRKNSSLISCALAVSMDPLFLYIPVIEEHLKCVKLDWGLMHIALVLRFCTDIWYLASIHSQLHFMRTESPERLISTKIWQSHGLIETFALFPIPYFVIRTLPKMRGSNSRLRMFLNALLVLQHIPRVLRIYLVRSMRVPTLPRFRSSHFRTWVGGLFMFFMFILASHILGAFWYYFSFQRNIDCWFSACKEENGCDEFGTIGCPRNTTTTRNITLLNDLCPINIPNSTVFNFCIFFDALHSDMLNSRNFSQKFFHCFWWGLRNLSSFGQNLQTSTYAWENLFAVLICMTGMLLVLIYLNAISQKCMQSEQTKSYNREMKMKRTEEIETWLRFNNLAMELKGSIVEYVMDGPNPDEHVNSVNILSNLPWRLSRDIKKDICSDMLNRVPLFRIGGERSLALICRYLQPAIFTADSFIIEVGAPIDKMLFITHGVAWIYNTSPDGSGSSNTSSIRKGDHYGEELLNLAPDIDLLNLPISNRSVKCSSCTDVEAFFLTAEDLRSIKIDLVGSDLHRRIPHTMETSYGIREGDILYSD